MGVAGGDGVSADLLREAAAFMRERAEAATPGPWAVGHNYGATVSPSVTEHPSTGGIGGADDIEAYGGYLIGESMTRANIAHVAAWHPAVALAVADWLDEAADFLAAYRGETHAMDNPLAVARTYLGRSS